MTNKTTEKKIAVREYTQLGLSERPNVAYKGLSVIRILRDTMGGDGWIAELGAATWRS